MNHEKLPIWVALPELLMLRMLRSKALSRYRSNWICVLQKPATDPAQPVLDTTSLMLQP